jgi:uncharacterized protein YyaL (SSP411 family)
LPTGERRLGSRWRNALSGGARLLVLASLLLALPLLGATGTARCGDTQRSARFTNRLIGSNDPYLLLHAHNPVDWYPWGPEALGKAKRENKPIFLSIGYSTCYWCHVAERTIYSNAQIAKLMNQWFVNIKVDREQRPDLDNIYMQARELISGNGSWPNNVFLTPDLKPFYAGSYFPASDDGPGRPGFPAVLRSIHDAWIKQRLDVVREADMVYSAMLEQPTLTAVTPATALDPPVLLGRARDEILSQVDAVHGGISNGYLKFPSEPMLRLLIEDYRSSRSPGIHDALIGSLDAMALGGIHDQLGGGFHRYSTEPSWSVPHFEKMLYDNAQLLDLYDEAFRLTASPLYAQVADDIAGYLARQMTDPLGGFYSAEDAEVDGREGANYLWTHREIQSLLGQTEASSFFQVYTLTPLSKEEDVDRSGGVLRVRLPIEDTLRRAGTTDIASTLAAFASDRAQLLAAREHRPQPRRDEKIIVAWNALTISALARSAPLLGPSEYLPLAHRAAERLWRDAYHPGSGELDHEIFRGRAQSQGYLDDYALLGIAFLDLNDATGGRLWRDRALQLAAALQVRFLRNRTFVPTRVSSDLLIEPKDHGDDSMPSGTSAAVELFTRLSTLTGDANYADSVRRTVLHLSAPLQRHPERWATTVIALNSGASSIRDLSRVLSTADHVHASAAARSAVDHDELTVTLIVDPGFHINANPASLDYLIPTQLSINGVTGVQLAYPNATIITPPFAPEGLKVYEGSIALQGVAPKGTFSPGESISGTVQVQACDDQSCLPPATLPVIMELRP